MPEGKLRDYDWRIATFLAECVEFLDTEHSAFQFPGDDEVGNTGAFCATIVFRDGSQLYVRASLDEGAEVREYDYAYICFDRNGRRVFQYDDAPHHPHISTRPPSFASRREAKTRRGTHLPPGHSACGFRRSRRTHHRETETTLTAGPQGAWIACLTPQRARRRHSAGAFVFLVVKL